LPAWRFIKRDLACPLVTDFLQRRV
jgi:hypothetical protein